jgi:hypothetical protein
VLYVFQKGIDRRNALIELRRKTYQDFTDSFFETTALGTAESLAHFNNCAARLPLWDRMTLLQKWEFGKNTWLGLRREVPKRAT